MAGIFSKEQKSVLYAGVNRVADIMQDNWYKNEATEFMNNEMAQFQASTAQFYDMMSKEDDPDAMAQGFLGWKNQTLMPFLNTNTVKYAKNPYIAQTIQNVAAQNQNGLKDYLSVEEQLHQRAGRGARAEQAAAESEATVAQKRGAGAESQARAGLLREQTKYVGQEAAAKLAKTDTSWIQPGSHPATWRSQLMNPKNIDKFKEHYEGPARREIAMQALRDSGQIGKPYGGMTPGNIGSDPEKDIAYAYGKGLAPQDAVERLAMKNALRDHAGWAGPEAWRHILPDDSNDLIAERQGRMGLQGDAGNMEILAQMMGQEDALKLSVIDDLDHNDQAAIVKALPSSYQELSPGPVRSAFDQALMTKPGPKGGWIYPGIDEPVKNFEDFQSAILADLQASAVRTAVGGSTLSDDQLDKQTLKGRRKAAQLARLMVMKYSGQIGSEVGIVDPESYEAGISLISKQLGLGKVAKGFSWLGELFDDEETLKAK
jgi:hypothetical protein